MEKSEFEKLAKNLSDKERQDLLSKLKPEDRSNIEKSDSYLSQKREDKKLTAAEQYKIALENFKKSGFLDKFLVILASFFSGKNKEELIVEKEFSRLKKEIQNKYYNILNFEDKTFTANFANEIILLNESVQKVKEIVDVFFRNTEFYNEFIFTFLEKQFGEGLKQALKKIEPEDIKSTEFIDKTAFLRERDRRIKEFFDVVDKTKFDFHIKQIEKLEIALKILKFDYGKLLQPFGISNGSNLANIKANASFLTLEKNLEKLYSLLLSFNFSNLNIPILNDFSAFSKSRDIFNKFLTDGDIKKIGDSLISFRTFLEKAPMDKIFKYCKRDILYTPLEEVSTLNPVEIYKDLKRKEIRDIWENYYIESKKNDLSKLITELFGEKDFFSLNFFNENLYNEVYKNSGVKFTSVYFLNILLFFIKKFYKHNIETAVAKILIDGTFSDDMSKFHLTGGYHAINNAFEKINAFDARFNTESDLGKKLKLYIERTSGINDVDMKKSFQSYANDINDSGVALSREIFNGISIVSSFFEKLSPSTDKSEKPLINTESIRFINHQNLHALLEKYGEIFSKFFKIYKQIEIIY